MNNSLEIPIDDIKALALHSFDVRNPSNEDLSVLNFVPLYNGFWLSRHALRRLPVKRPLVDSHVCRLPFAIKLTSHELESEIARYDLSLAQSVLPTSIPSTLLHKSSAKYRLHEFFLCRKLGFDPNLWQYCCEYVITELSDMDFLWSKPDLTQDKIFVVSDGSEKDGIGGMATLIADPVLQKVFVFACQVSPGAGKVLPIYRAAET